MCFNLKFLKGEIMEVPSSLPCLADISCMEAEDPCRSQPGTQSHAGCDSCPLLHVIHLSPPQFLSIYTG